MANARKLGFTPTSVTGGSTVTHIKRRVLTNNTLAIALGDTCTATAAGDITACAAGTDEQIMCGTVQSGGVMYTDGTGKRIEAKNLPAATLYTSTGAWPDNASYAYCVDNATMVTFEANVANVAIALTDLNLNYPVVLTVSNTTTGLSNHELNATGRAVTATFPWRVRDFVQRADNDISLVDCKVLCMINAGQLEPVTSVYLGK